MILRQQVVSIAPTKRDPPVTPGGVLEGRGVRVCVCAAAQGSGVLEGRGVRVCVCAAAQGSGVLEGGV